MINLFTRYAGNSVVQRVRGVYYSVFMQAWPIPLISLLVSIIRALRHVSSKFETSEGLIFLFALISIVLSREEYVHKRFSEIYTIRHSIIVISWSLICLCIVAGFNLPFPFRELLSLQQMSLVSRIIVEACTLGVGANILLLWVYSFLEYHQKLAWANYVPALVKSFLRTFVLVLFNPLALIVFALNNLIVMFIHFGLITFFDRVAVTYPYGGDIGHLMVLSLRIWVPLVLLIPFYTTVTAVVYERITAARHDV
jgi:lysylphosphatidylglycerol synthetase-like protein (DUF2156 family)